MNPELGEDLIAPNIGALLNPQNICIVGARDGDGGWADRIYGNLKRFGFGGQIYPVNPRRDQVWDEKAYPDMVSIPDQPDHALIVIPSRFAVDAVADAVASGARSATILSGGFSPEQLAEIQAMVNGTGFALSGPNCLGNISVPAKLITTTDSRLAEIKDGPVAIVGQSGGVVTAMNRALVGRGIGVRHMVSSGNETCVTTAGYIRYFGGDDGIRVVVAFVESVRDHERFFEACTELANAGKYLVALKVGQTVASRDAAASHTGALAGSYAAFEAVAATRGVVTVGTIDLAVEACEYLSRVPMPSGGKVAVVTVSGGVRELVLDGAGRTGAELADFSVEARKGLSSLIGEDLEVSNPLDSGFAGLSDPNVLVSCVETVAADPEVGLILLQEELLGRPEPKKEKTLRLYDESFAGGVTRTRGIPVSLFSMASFGANEYGHQIRDGVPNLSFLQGTEKALGVASALLRTAGHVRRAAGYLHPGTEGSPRREAALAMLAELPQDLTEVEAKRLLSLYGFSSPDEMHVSTAEEAEKWASTNTAPFVVKLVARGLTHKTEAGGVVVNLQDSAEVASACRAMGVSNPANDGYIVGRHVSGGVELILGFTNDPEVGPVVAVGLGGVSVELFGDVALVPAYCTAEQAFAAIESTNAGTVLGNWRGRLPSDIDSVVRAVCSMAELAGDLVDVLESAEVNPLVALAATSGTFALDALVVRKLSS